MRTYTPRSPLLPGGCKLDEFVKNEASAHRWNVATKPVLVKPAKPVDLNETLWFEGTHYVPCRERDPTGLEYVVSFPAHCNAIYRLAD